MKAKGAKAKRYRVWFIPYLNVGKEPWRFYPGYYTRQLIRNDIQRTTVYNTEAEAAELAATAKRVIVTIEPARPAKPKARRAKA